MSGFALRQKPRHFIRVCVHPSICPFVGYHFFSINQLICKSLRNMFKPRGLHLYCPPLTPPPALPLSRTHRCSYWNLFNRKTYNFVSMRIRSLICWRKNRSCGGRKRAIIFPAKSRQISGEECHSVTQPKAHQTNLWPWDYDKITMTNILCQGLISTSLIISIDCSLIAIDDMSVVYLFRVPLSDTTKGTPNQPMTLRLWWTCND